MITINIIIAKRGRDKYLKLLLHSLNQADNVANYDIAVYIGEDIEKNINKIDYSVYDNIKIQHSYIPNLPQAGEFFCCGHLYNILLQGMRQNYDFLCIMDIDMVYCKSFFIDMVSVLGDCTNINCCLLSHGTRMKESAGHEEILQSNCDYTTIVNNYPCKSFAAGDSQISTTKYYHEYIKKILGVKSIYDTASLGYYFMGWGREDALVAKILKFSKAKVITKKNSWVHVWHEPQSMLEESLQYNNSIFFIMVDEVKLRMKRSKCYVNPINKNLHSLAIG